MSLFNHYTRGGQVAMHNLRMFKQVVLVTITVAVLLGMLSFGVLSWRATNSYQWYLYSEYLTGRHLSFGDESMVDFRYPQGTVVKIRTHDLLNNRWFSRQIMGFEQTLQRLLRFSGYASGAGTLLAIVYFLLRGRQQKQKQVLKGDQLLTPQQFNKCLKDKRSDLKLAGCHLVKDAEMAHMLIAGTTGAGKTNCLHELLPQIRARGNRAVIVDLRGNLVPTYYRPGKDTILNPFDARSQGWHLWAECQHSYQFDAMAEVLLPSDKSSSGDHDWWLKAGRAMLSVTAQKMQQQGNFSTQKLKDLLIALPLKDLIPFFQGTDMAALATKESDRVASSVRNVMTPMMRKLAHLPDTQQPFSIRDWVAQDSGDDWLFLTAGPDQKDTLQPLISAWLGWALQSLKTLPETHQARLWFVADELPQLKYLPSLEDGLAEIRGFGGCFVAGIQDFHQLQKLYGMDGAHTLLTLFNTKLVFNCPDKKTADYMAAFFGTQDTKERVEGVSFGANDMRDGVSLNDRTKTENVVPAADLMALPKLQAYLKAPGGYPPVKLKFDYQQIQATQPKFVSLAEAIPLETTSASDPTDSDGLAAQSTVAGQKILKQDDHSVEFANQLNKVLDDMLAAHDTLLIADETLTMTEPTEQISGSKPASAFDRDVPSSDLETEL